MDEGYRYEDLQAGLSVVHKPRAHTNPQRHYHGSWEILFLASGERTFFHGSATWRVRSGDALLVRPQVLHRALNRNDQDCDLYNLYFSVPDSTWFGQVLPLLEACAGDANPVIPVPAGERYRIVRLFSDIARELDERDRGYENAAWGQANIMVTLLARYASRRMETGDSAGPRSALRPEIARLIDWLSLHFTENLPLALLAEKTDLSPAHLSRLFHRETRYTLTEYLASLRVREACRLLAETRLRASDIAERCGFGSAAQFGRVFRGLTGQSPLQWRKAFGSARY